jgi:hypothetical protein
MDYYNNKLNNIKIKINKMGRSKKTIRLTESEMVNLIETIVNEVKREKINQISESRKFSGRRTNRRSY